MNRTASTVSLVERTLRTFNSSGMNEPKPMRNRDQRGVRVELVRLSDPDRMAESLELRGGACERAPTSPVTLRSSSRGGGARSSARGTKLSETPKYRLVRGWYVLPLPELSVGTDDVSIWRTMSAWSITRSGRRREVRGTRRCRAPAVPSPPLLRAPAAGCSRRGRRSTYDFVLPRPTSWPTFVVPGVVELARRGSTGRSRAHPSANAGRAASARRTHSGGLPPTATAAAAHPGPA